MQTHGSTSHGRESGCSYHGVVQECTAERHGTDDAYMNAHCRCPDAREDHRVQRKRRKLRLLETGPSLRSGIGTARRLQALSAIGYGIGLLSAELGMSRAHVAKLRRAGHPVTRDTHGKVCAFYNRAWNVSPPQFTRIQRSGVTRTRRYAATKGWLPPIALDDDLIEDADYDPRQLLIPDHGKGNGSQVADKCVDYGIADLSMMDIDPIAVDRFVHGDTTVTLNRAEKRCAYKEMLSRGVSRNEVVRWLRISWTTAREFAETLVTEPSSVMAGDDAEHVSEVAS